MCVCVCIYMYICMPVVGEAGNVCVHADTHTHVHMLAQTERFPKRLHHLHTSCCRYANTISVVYCGDAQRSLGVTHTLQTTFLVGWFQGCRIT